MSDPATPPLEVDDLDPADPASPVSVTVSRPPGVLGVPQGLGDPRQIWSHSIRDEMAQRARDVAIIPVLRGLQHVYGNPTLRDSILELIAQDVNPQSSASLGRKGMGYWQIFVLASVRLGCDLDYDKLQDLAENHAKLRAIMQVGLLDATVSFDWRRIRNNVCQVRPETIEEINNLIVTHGQELLPEAVKQARGDSFVVKANIHYPTDASLIWDGLRRLLRIASQLATLLDASGWRQHQHLRKKIKRQVRQAEKAAASKSRNREANMVSAFRALFASADRIVDRAQSLLSQAESALGDMSTSLQAMALTFELDDYVTMTEQVLDVAKRRILDKERVPKDEKLFSLFEPHTELINRGKRPNPNEFGHLVFVLEDGAGFVSYYKVMEPGELDQDLTIPAIEEAQDRCDGQIESASFDKGFHSRDNQRELAELVSCACLPEKSPRRAAEQARQASDAFRAARRRHPGIESEIGSLVRGNGLDRCRDRTLIGFKRFVGLAVLGRNLHVLGKILIQQSHPKALAATSKRKRPAA